MASNIATYGVGKYGVARYGTAVLDNETTVTDSDTIKNISKTILNQIHATEFYFRFLNRIFSELMNEIEEDDTISFNMTTEITNVVNSTDNVYKLTDRTVTENISFSDIMNKLAIKQILNTFTEDDGTINFDISKKISNAINTTDKFNKGLVLELVEAIYSADTKTRDIYKSVFESVTVLDDVQERLIRSLLKQLYSQLEIDTLKSTLSTLFDYTVSLEINGKSSNITRP